MSFNAYVIGGGLNMRASCSTSSTRKTQIPTGTAIVVNIVPDEPEWFATTYNGYSGFVVAQYVAITADGGECIPNVENSLNIRKKPVSGATRLYSAYPDDTLRLLDCNSVDGWYRVSSANGTGWAMSEFLNIVSYPETSTPDPEEPDVPVDPDDPDAPDFYGVTRNDPYYPDWQGYYQSTADRYPSDEDRIAPIVAGVTIPLWGVVGVTDVFRTEYNGEVAYVNIDYVELVENGTPTLAEGSSGAGVINCKYHLAALHYHPNELTQTFDGLMTVATKIFQQHNNLTVTGIIDANTRALLCSGNAEQWYDTIVNTWYNSDDEPGYHPPMQWFMGDSMWSNYPWPSVAVGDETIGMDGNSITTLAMLATTMMNWCITPVEMAELTLQHGYRDPSGQKGIEDAFYADIENFYMGVIYAGETTSLDAVKRHLANGGLAVAYVTADENKTYTGGATQLLVYRIDETANKVFVRSPNQNKNPAPLSINEWKTGGWFRKAYLYDRTYG